MNENTMNLINAIQAGDAAAVETAFQDAMADKIAPKLDAMRQDVASSMFQTVTINPEAGTATIDATVE